MKHVLAANLKAGMVINTPHGAKQVERVVITRGFVYPIALFFYGGSKIECAYDHPWEVIESALPGKSHAYSMISLVRVTLDNACRLHIDPLKMIRGLQQSADGTEYAFGIDACKPGMICQIKFADDSGMIIAAVPFPNSQHLSYSITLLDPPSLVPVDCNVVSGSTDDDGMATFVVKNHPGA